MLSPIKAQDEPFVRYEMHIPGMMFEFFLNGDPKYDTWSLNNVPERIVLSSLPTQRLRQIAAQNIPLSEPKGGLKKKLSSMGRLQSRAAPPSMLMCGRRHHWRAE